MKQLVTTGISLFLCCSCVLAQNTVLRGIIKLQSSGSLALANVEVAAFGTNAVYSNSNGMFELKFPDKKPGDRVSLIITKAGYEVLNDRETDQVVLRTNPDEIIVVVMSRQGERDRQALKYYNIILTNTNANYEQELKGIKAKLVSLDETADERKALYRQIEELNNEKQRLTEKAEDLARQLSSVDLDQASVMTREAIALVGAGDIKKAIEVLDNDALMRALTEARDERSKAELRMAQADSALHQSIANFILKARLCKSDGREDEAKASYLNAIEADSTDYDNIIEFADYRSQLYENEEALRYYTHAVNLATGLKERVDALLKLAAQNTIGLEFEAAESQLQEVLNMLNSADENVTDLWKAHVKAYTYYRLGDTYYRWRKPPESLQNSQYAAALYDSLLLVADDPEDSLKRADVLMLMAGVNRDLREYGPADSLYSIVRQVFEDFAARSPEKYTRKLSSVYYNSAVMYSYLDLDRADTLFHKAIEIYQKLNTEQFHSQDVRIADANWGLARVYYRQQQYTRAESQLDSVLAAFTELATNRSESFIADVGRTHSMNALVKMALEKSEEAERELMTALEIYQGLAETYPDKFNIEIARVYGNLADHYLRSSQFAPAERAARDGLQAYPKAEWINSILAPALVCQGKFEEASVIYTEYKGKEYRSGIPGNTWTDVFIQTLDELEGDGIVHPDFDRVRGLLED